MRKLARAFYDKSGTSLIEAAIVMPFVLMLGVGVTEYGNALYLNQQITTGVSDAARYLAHQDVPLDHADKARSLALTGSITGGEKRVPDWTDGDITITMLDFANPVDTTTGERPYRGGDPIRVVRVSTDYNYVGFGGLNSFGLGSVLNIGVSHEERVIGE